MPGLTQIVAWEVKGFLLALFTIVAGQLFTGQISTKKLLFGRKNDTGQPIFDENGRFLKRKKEDTAYFSPERVQLLLMTLGAAFYYLTQVLNNPNPGEFPPLPASWPAVLGGSNAVYLGGKAFSRFWSGQSNSK